MSRRVTLPGADELFRSTAPAGQPAAAPDTPSPASAAVPVAAAAPAPASEPGTFGGPVAAPEPPVLSAVADDDDLDESRVAVRRRPRATGERRPTGRERHDEKITVYCSAEELIDIERARLTLRGEYGLAADRGRIVREALAVVLSDLEAKGEQSILVRRLRGR